ncbi:scavenger receptor cysteine-rich type 1 protein M130-like [Strongylocentrotus purpuratus]|uniref:SRCR domain-containing protein n=1 Tax=Strongylocentrotus purpuratus TaxID=7668 RepID=A0A7M7PC26_STRPU|nr:scavenger receptor cysteine-rich type 1 protein M130-like [Strongylocentrotus purpuratus]
MIAITDMMKVLTLFWIHLMMGATICYFGSGDASQTTACNANEDRIVRLATGTNSSEGNVQVCVNGTRGHVCGASWDIADANVVCLSLGFTRAIRSFSEVSTEFSNDEIVLYNVDCRGDESSLFDCPHDVNLTGNCHLGGTAGIECSNDLEYSVCVPGLCHGDLEMKGCATIQSV